MWLAITLLVAVWLLTLVAAYFFGYKFRDLTERVNNVQQVVQSNIQNKPDAELPPVSQVIDPLDPVANAIWEREQMMKRMNNGPNSTDN